MVKNPLSSSGDVGLIPGLGVQIPHAVGDTEPARRNYDLMQPNNQIFLQCFLASQFIIGNVLYTFRVVIKSGKISIKFSSIHEREDFKGLSSFLARRLV